VSLVLGIDGGGSKTTAAVARAGSVLGTHTAAGCNLNSVPADQVRAALTEAIEGALRQANATANDVSSACAGVAGAASPQMAEAITSILATLLPRTNLRVVGDTLIALESEFRGSPGVICISGTGSVAFGRNERGEFARAGGWGRFVSDEGSGHWIGQRALVEVLQALDMGRSSSLITAIMDHWRIATREQLVQECNRDSIPNFSELFPIVMQAQLQGDPLASEVLTSAGTRLARAAQIVVRRLWISPGPVEIVLSGGVFANCARIRQVFGNVVRSDRPEVKVRLSAQESYVGALHLAQQAMEHQSLT
jgi:N-acetylglucosamine kinase-like BadF-type ATPase